MTLAVLESLANRTVKADFYNIHDLMDEYAAAIESYMAQTSRRDLVTADRRDCPEGKAKRVELSRFWKAVETMAERVDYVRENIERASNREANIARTRREWETLERAYLEETIGKRPVLPAGDKRRVCAAWGCRTVYLPRTKRPSKFCSEKCRRNQKSAEARLKANGTYLPVKEYDHYRQTYAALRSTAWEASLGAAHGVATDGRDYRKRTRRGRTSREVAYFDRLRERREREKPGKVVRYNLADVAHIFDERGRLQFVE
ncbi:hypothetical protein ACFCP7_00375 [Paenibacillus elgii]